MSTPSYIATSRTQDGYSAARWAYLAAIVVTAAFHVPRNDTLAALDPNAAESARYWTTYLSQWTAGNHVRTLTCAAAAVMFTVAARRVP